MRDDLRFNVGCRYDDYSDFGDAVSPRAGLNWEFIGKSSDKNTSMAALFVHLHSRSCYEPTWGSTDLDATTVDTYSLTFNGQSYTFF